MKTHVWTCPLWYIVSVVYERNTGEYLRVGGGGGGGGGGCVPSVMVKYMKKNPYNETSLIMNTFCQRPLAASLYRLRFH